MNIHEYQSKAILKSFGAPVSEGQPALTVKEAVAAAKILPGPVYVVKSQIHAGGRGKGKFKELPSDAKGGVRLAKSVDEVAAHAREMLGHTLITAQTGPAGKQVNRLYIEDGCDIEKEFYLSMLVDRETSRVAFVVSTEGGMDIEKVAHDTPDKIVTFSIDPATGVMAHHGRAVARALGLIGNLAKQAESLTTQLYSAFVGTDMAMLEINPLVVTKQGELRCLDAKVSFDSNALYRHSEVVKLRDLTEEDGKEIEALNTISTISRLKARSAAWSTAPVWLWRPWTLSNFTAQRRQTSSMSAVARLRKRLRPRSRSSHPIPM
jgi:succinyl-CoA synthetase beta subunit